MFKKIAFLGVGLAMLSMPVLASAQSTNQSEVTALQAQVQQLLQQLEQLVGSGTASTTLSTQASFSSSSAAHWLCPIFTRSLSLGASGSDVTSLQQFLSQEGDFSGQATGFFGSLTQAAVQKWQAQNSIVASGTASTTGWGVFGTLSRDWLQKWCGSNGGGGSSSFSTSPTSGPAPLQVAFTAPESDSGDTVNFGDGTTGTLTTVVASCPPTGTCTNGGAHAVAWHTYTTAGTYTATGVAACSGTGCTAALLGSVTITVTGQNQTGNLTATPTSGTAPLSVTFTSFSNQNLAAGGTITFGDGTSGSMSLSFCNEIQGAGGGCQYSASHTYTQAGTYTATLLFNNCPASVPECPGAEEALGSVTITVGGQQTGSVSISSINPISGPTGTQVTITGSGFTATGNTIHFGGGGSLNVVSSNGSTITYTIPTNISGCDLAQGQDCGQWVEQVQPGSYSIYVSNANGTSNTETFTVTTGSTVGSSFSASPTSGSAPLAVTFTSNTAGTVNFGDGTTGTLSQNATPAYLCLAFAGSNCTNPLQATYSISHTYQSAGTYTATGEAACSGTACTAALLGSVTITVGGQQTGSVSISSINPISGPTGTQVTITGSGFTATGNTVHFASGGSASVASTNGGTMIAYTIPASTGPCNVVLGEACPLFLQVIQPGTYSVSVSNANGTSNTESFTVTSVGSTGTPTLSALPTWGSAPLSVTFTSSVSGTVNFGDGTSGTLTPNATPAILCGTQGGCANPLQTYSVSHTYQSAGTYTATGEAACSGTACTAPLLGSVTITVGTSSGTGSQNSTLSASPTSGSAPLSVTFTSNTSGTVNFGDGTSGTLTPNPMPAYVCANAGFLAPASTMISSNCQNPTQTYSVSHTYNTGGTYTATLAGFACPGALLSFATQPGCGAQSATITVTGAPISNSPVTNPGTSCTATGFGGGAYPNGSILQSICSPNSTACPAGLFASTWMCVNSQWQQQGSQTSQGATSAGSCVWAESGKTFSNGSVIQACNPASSGSGCPVGLLYPAGFTGYEMCSNGQWTPTPAPATQTNTSSSQTISGSGGSCLVQTHYCGNITVPNGSFAEDTHLCGTACQMQQCVNGTMNNVGNAFSQDSTSGYVNLSCNGEPYSAMTTDSNANVANVLTALQSILQSLLGVLQ